MNVVYVLVPGDLQSRTGGYGYDRRMIDGLRERGWSVVVIGLDSSFPQPTTAARMRAATLVADIPDGAVVVADGLAFGVMPDIAERERQRLKLVALVHHPLAAETGLGTDLAAQLFESERQSLATTRLVITTSDTTRAALGSYGVRPERIVVVEPGTDPARPARGSSGCSQFISVASVVPRKGFLTLAEALGMLRDRPWRLDVVGSLERDPETVARFRAKLEDTRTADRVTFAGELAEAELDRAYDRSDLFVLPTYYEGYGMAVAESLARGIPVVSTPTGGIPELVGAEAGMLVPAGDPQALCDALGRWLDDSSVRERLQRGAREVRASLPTWRQSVDAMAGALGMVAAGE